MTRYPPTDRERYAVKCFACTEVPKSDAEKMKVLDTLQAGRALAALCVVLRHASIAPVVTSVSVPPSALKLFELGILGVDFFFVLSGFIILYSYQGAPVSIKTYILKRVSRVYVPYWPIGIAMVLAYSLTTLESGHHDWSMITSLFLLPTGRPPALSVAWTLVHEILFYAIFCLYFISRRWFPWVVAAWSAGMLVSAALHGFAQPYTPGPVGLLLSPLNLEFVMGMVCVVLMTRIPRQFAPTLICAGLAGTLASAAMFAVLSTPRELCGLMMAVAVLGFALVDDKARRFIPPGLVFLGGASYALYLIHHPVISAASRIYENHHWVSSVLFLVCVSVVAGVLYHVLVENPMLRQVRLPIKAKA